MQTKLVRLLSLMLTTGFALLTAQVGLAGERPAIQPALGSAFAGHHAIAVLNQDQFEGNWKQFKGDLKKKWGKLTDDDLLEIEGNYDKFEGKLQERYGDRKAEVKRWADEWFEKHEHKSSRH